MNEWNECIDIVHVMIIHNIHESIDNIDDEPQKKKTILTQMLWEKENWTMDFFFIFSRLFTQVCSFSFFFILYFYLLIYISLYSIIIRCHIRLNKLNKKQNQKNDDNDDDG